MDKKSFFKGLLSGVGASVLAFLVAVGVYSCSNPPKDNKNENASSLVEDNRSRLVISPKNVPVVSENYVLYEDSNGSYSGNSYNGTWGLQGNILLSPSVNFNFNGVLFWSGAPYCSICFYTDTYTSGQRFSVGYTDVPQNPSNSARYVSSNNENVDFSLSSCVGDVFVSFTSVHPNFSNDTVANSIFDYWFSLAQSSTVDLSVSTQNATYSGTTTGIAEGGSTSITFTPNAGYNFRTEPSPISYINVSNCSISSVSSAGNGAYVVNLSDIQEGASISWVPTLYDPILNLSHCTLTSGQTSSCIIGNTYTWTFAPSTGYSLLGATKSVSNIDNPVWTYDEVLDTWSLTGVVRGGATINLAPRIFDLYVHVTGCYVESSTIPNQYIGSTGSVVFVQDDVDFDLSGAVIDGEDVDLYAGNYDFTSEEWVVDYEVTGLYPEIYCYAPLAIEGLQVNTNGTYAIQGSPSSFRYGKTYHIEFTPIGWDMSFKDVYPVCEGCVASNLTYWNGKAGMDIRITSPRPVIKMMSTAVSPIAYYEFPDFYSPVGMFGTDLSFDYSVVKNDSLSTGYENYIVLKGITFSNQGIVYNRIKIGLLYVGDNGTYTGLYVGENVVTLDGNYFIVGSVWYGYTDDDSIGWNDNLDYKYLAGQVNSQYLAEVPNTIAHPVTMYYAGIRWINDNARKISVYYVDGFNGTRISGIGSNMDDWSFLQNYSAGAVAPVYSQSVGFNNNYDPFTLIASAMGCVTSFMSWTILPGLTIGILWTIPVIIVLIIVVFKLIKK